eukprot:CAMPEP_0113470370 /NCGR_PEP_ID=MMETSP0014_2-20120614/16406_1 /TAXON_ID=2857 /ORGANISM="Nitzschia sp." /LENGTH=288 /DNA_ID=CAMNT_0000362929 /DNA_START=102 /DNA_END=968 /DNA_ORIENTATION=- /assembly_acc=CAM_ASM_000159
MIVSKLDHQASAPSTSMEASTATTVPTSTVATTMSSSLASVVSKSTISSKTKVHCSSRTKLLNRLGYFQPPGVNNKGMANKALASPSSSSSSSSSPSSVSSSSSSVSLLGSVPPLQTPLNDVSVAAARTTTITTTETTRTVSEPIMTEEPRAKVNISNINNKVDGSGSMTPLWSCRFHHGTSIPTESNASSGLDVMNSMRCLDGTSSEFQAEGWDWRTVVEDEDMYIDVQTGQKLHPCHIQYHCDQQQHHHQNNEEEEEEKDDYSSDEDGDDRYFQPLKRQESSAFAA